MKREDASASTERISGRTKGDSPGLIGRERDDEILEIGERMPNVEHRHGMYVHELCEGTSVRLGTHVRHCTSSTHLFDVFVEQKDGVLVAVVLHSFGIEREAVSSKQSAHRL